MILLISCILFESYIKGIIKLNHYQKYPMFQGYIYIKTLFSAI